MNKSYLEHHGIKGQRWGVRRYRNEDGTVTDAGKKRRKIAKRIAIGAAITASIIGATAGYMTVTKTATKHILEEGKKRADEYIHLSNIQASSVPGGISRRVVFANEAAQITAKTNQKAKEVGGSFIKSARYLYNLRKKG